MHHTGLQSRVGEVVLLLETLEELAFSCLLQLLETTCIFWLMAPFSIFKPSIIASSDLGDLSLPTSSTSHLLARRTDVLPVHMQLNPV